MGILFVAGVYGVGKSTLCSSLSESTQTPYFSAGDLISNVNSELYGSNKFVSNKYNNQDVLVDEVQKQLKIHPHILLAGHFCIFTKNNEVDYLPENTFSRLGITSILLLETSTNLIVANLLSRDKREYTYQQIFELQHAEHSMASRISLQIGCKTHAHMMKFDGTDLDDCLSFLQKGGCLL